MDKMQKALIKHINDSGIFKTVKPYAGEIKDAVKLTSIIPAALIVFMTGSIKENKTRGAFDVLVISESKTFDKTKSVQDNLKYAGDLLRYCNENLVFDYEGDSYIFNRDIYQSQESDHPFTAEMILQNDRYTIIAVHLSVLK